MSKATRAAKAKRTTKTAGLVSGHIKYFTRAHLIECAALGRKWGYNRQVDDSVAEVPEARYPVVLAMPHYNRQAVRCEEHVRCVVTGEGGQLIAYIDVPVRYYLDLPVARVRMSKKLAQQVRPLAA